MATREEVFATAAAVLVENGVLKEKGVIGKATAAVTGASKYEVNTAMINDGIPGKLVDALERLDNKRGAVLENAKLIGLDRLMQSGGAVKDLQEGAAENIGKVASGKGVAGHLEAKLNEVADAAKDKIKAADPVTKIRGAAGIKESNGELTQLAANTPQKGNSIRANMINEGAAQNGKGEVREEQPHEPSHGLPAKINRPQPQQGRADGGASR